MSQSQKNGLKHTDLLTFAISFLATTTKFLPENDNASHKVKQGVI